MKSWNLSRSAWSGCGSLEFAFWDPCGLRDCEGKGKSLSCLECWESWCRVVARLDWIGSTTFSRSMVLLYAWMPYSSWLQRLFGHGLRMSTRKTQVQRSASFDAECRQVHCNAPTHRCVATALQTFERACFVINVLTSQREEPASSATRGHQVPCSQKCSQVSMPVLMSISINPWSCLWKLSSFWY